MEDQVLSVTKFINQMKMCVESEFRFVSIEGEVSNLSLSSAGHYYFNLSDKESSVSVALFKFDALKNPAIKKIKDGDKIICRGPISIYGKRGTFQLVAKIVEAKGEGDLLKQFEELKKKLSSEGLFDIAKKKKIPLFPKKIAIITAERGAALQDFLHIFNRRSFHMDILVIPSIVQGDTAPKSLIKSLKIANSRGDIDVVILARGGGSLEDLYCFNDENLAREIFKSNIPVISAVGHQIDFTISDYVSDFRAETPSAAAELLTTFQLDLVTKIETSGKILSSKLKYYGQKIDYYKERFHPRVLFSNIEKKVYRFRERLVQVSLKDRIHEFIRLHEFHYFLDECASKLEGNLKLRFLKADNKVENSLKLLETLNPKGILKRGYSYVESTDGKVIGNLADFQEIKKDEKFHVVFHDGKGAAIPYLGSKEIK